MKKLLMIAVAISLGACATPAYNRIDADARPLLTKMDSVLVVTQAEIGTEINHSAAGTATGGGLIGALIDTSIDAARSKKAENLIVPVRDKMLDFDFAEVMEAHLEEALIDTQIEKASEVTLVRGMETDYMNKMVGSSAADAVLFVNATYNLSANFSEMIVETTVGIYPATDELRKFSEKPDDDKNLAEYTDNIYRNTFRSAYPVSDMKNRDDNAEVVAELSADELQSALTSAAKLMSRGIADDIMKNEEDDAV